MENKCKQLKIKDKSVLERLTYEHKMFIEKFYEARHRLAVSITDLGGNYNAESPEYLKNISGESSYLDEYSYLLSIQKNVLADIYLGLERLEELVSK